jgi:DNA topoisomerase-1
MKQLIHNGILVPNYEWKRFHIFVNGKKINLTPEQEEMALAWVKKLGTQYVEDRVFVRNFFKDFGQALNIRDRLLPEDCDFSMIEDYVRREREFKRNLSREEKRRLAEQRKIVREANKERYGYAIVDGSKVEVANYAAEPSSIFMGRGKHPLRGRWKKGPKTSDIVLNLSPNATIPQRNWKEIVWHPEFMWIACWKDKLSGKKKYVWLADTFHVKQMKEIEKFDKARELANKIDEVRHHIANNLESTDVMRQKIATVCHLIDVFKLRVGDEKNKDEADTVGATTLRPKHITFGPNGLTIFNFIGKDAVRWRKEAELSELVVNNLKEFIEESNSTIFKGIRSWDASLFLDEVMPGLTAKVFRTYHASNVVKASLDNSDVSQSTPDYLKKYVATMANLGAAIVCNHKKKPRKNWRESLGKKIERLKKLKAKKTKKSKERAKVLGIKIKIMRATKSYNLGTSLKSYIDPRIYYEWGKRVEYDWRLYYPKTLQRKFSWVEE